MRIDVATLIITSITLVLVLFTAWTVHRVVDRVNVVVDKIENVVTNPVAEVEGKAKSFIEKELEHGIRKLEGE